MSESGGNWDRVRSFEDIANEMELLGGPNACERADHLRRIASDAKREALREAIVSIQGLEKIYRNDLYRKAWKVAVDSLNTLILGIR